MRSETSPRSVTPSRAGRLAEQLLKEKPDEYDAYLAVGVENYLTGIKPAPVRWLLQMGGVETDKQQGILKLKETALHGDLLAPFAKLLLAVAALRDKDTEQACGLLRGLVGAISQEPSLRAGAPSLSLSGASFRGLSCPHRFCLRIRPIRSTNRRLSAELTN